MLVALHGFWALTVVPPVVWATRSLSAVALRRLGATVTLFGLLAVTTFLGFDLQFWLAEDPGLHVPYAGRRVLFDLATLVHVPLLQLTAAGLVCWRAGRRRLPAADSANERTPDSL